MHAEVALEKVPHEGDTPNQIEGAHGEKADLGETKDDEQVAHHTEAKGPGDEFGELIPEFFTQGAQAGENHEQHCCHEDAREEGEQNRQAAKGFLGLKGKKSVDVHGEEVRFHQPVYGLQAARRNRENIVLTYLEYGVFCARATET